MTVKILEMLRELRQELADGHSNCKEAFRTIIQRAHNDDEKGLRCATAVRTILAMAYVLSCCVLLPNHPLILFNSFVDENSNANVIGLIDATLKYDDIEKFENVNAHTARQYLEMALVEQELYWG